MPAIHIYDSDPKNESGQYAAKNIDTGKKINDYNDSLLVWLFTYCPTLRADVGSGVSHESSQEAKGQQPSLPLQDLDKAGVGNRYLTKSNRKCFKSDINLNLD